MSLLNKFLLIFIQNIFSGDALMLVHHKSLSTLLHKPSIVPQYVRCSSFRQIRRLLCNLNLFAPLNLRLFFPLQQSFFPQKFPHMFVFFWFPSLTINKISQWFVISCVLTRKLPRFLIPMDIAHEMNVKYVEIMHWLDEKEWEITYLIDCTP